MNTIKELRPLNSLSDDELNAWLFREESEAERIWSGWYLWDWTPTGGF